MRQHRLDGLGLGDLLRAQSGPVEHVEEIGIAAGVELVRAIELDAAIGEELGERPVHDGRAELRLDVVADGGNASAREPLAPLWSETRKTGMQLTRLVPVSRQACA